MQIVADPAVESDLTVASALCDGDRDGVFYKGGPFPDLALTHRIL